MSEASAMGAVVVEDEELDSPLDGGLAELTDYRGVLEEHGLTDAEWEAMDDSVRRESVENLAEAVSHSDADQNVKADCEHCADLARHLNGLGGDGSLEYRVTSSVLYGELRYLGFFLDEVPAEVDHVEMVPERGTEELNGDGGAESLGEAVDVDPFVETGVDVSPDSMLVSAYPEHGTGYPVEAEVLGEVQLKPGVWENGLDGVIEESGDLLDGVVDLLSDVTEGAMDLAEGVMDVAEEVVDATVSFGERTVDVVAEASTAVGSVAASAV